MKNYVQIFTILLFIFLISCKGGQKELAPSAANTSGQSTNSTAAPTNKETTDGEIADVAKTPTAKKPSKIELPEGFKPTEWTVIPGEKVGEIDVTYSHDDLIKTYGKKNVTKKRLQMSDILNLGASVVFPNTPNELLVFWKDTIKLERPIQVVIEGKGGKWETFHGLKVGSPIADVIKVNERAPLIVGFGYVYQGRDVSGTVYGWRDGRLTNDFGVTFEPSAAGKKHVAFQDFYSEDGSVFETEDNRVNQLELTIKTMKTIF